MRQVKAEKNTGNQLVTVNELAAVLHVSAESLRRWGRAGILPRHRLGARTLRYDVAEVVAALESYAQTLDA